MAAAPVLGEYIALEIAKLVPNIPAKIVAGRHIGQIGNSTTSGNILIVIDLAGSEFCEFEQLYQRLCLRSRTSTAIVLSRNHDAASSLLPAADHRIAHASPDLDSFATILCAVVSGEHECWVQATECPSSEHRPNKFSTISITRREHDVLAEILNGHSDKKIAVNLGIGLPTLQKRKMSIYDKFGIRHKLGLIAAMSNQDMPSRESLLR